jgi:hypothetical protein
MLFIRHALPIQVLTERMGNIRATIPGALKGLRQQFARRHIQQQFRIYRRKESGIDRREKEWKK